jgi:hypothetical protein
MTTTIHPWTMYEIARSRDEERLLRAEETVLALKARPKSSTAAEQRNPHGAFWFVRMLHFGHTAKQAKASPGRLGRAGV